MGVGWGHPIPKSDFPTPMPRPVKPLTQKQVENARWLPPERRTSEYKERLFDGGGMFLWVTLPEDMDAGEMFHSAIEKQVAYVVGSAFYPDGGGHNSFRMNFSYSSKAEIEEGVKRLGQVIGAWKGSRESAIITP